MTDLGLFVPENPVTVYPTIVAAVASTYDGSGSGSDCPRTVDFGPDLPPELGGRGLVRAQDYRRLHPVHYHSNSQAGACDFLFWRQNPWIDPVRLAILVKDETGRYLLRETPCISGDRNPEYRTLTLEGDVVCTTYPTAGFPTDPQLPVGSPGPFGPGTVGTGNYGGSAGARGLTGLPITVSGVNLGDVAKFLEGVGGKTDLSGVIQVLAALVLQGGNIAGRLRDVAPELASQLNPGFLHLAATLNQLAPGLSNRLALALDTQGTKAAEADKDRTASAVGAAVRAVSPFFGALVTASGEQLHTLSDVYKHSLDTLIGAILRLFRDDIEANAPVTAANVDKVAAAALRSALTAGSVAQLAGMGLELLHPLKNMGVQQAIGVLAEFAGFSEIARPFFGATLRYGLGLPAEHRAAAHFRSVLPPVGDVKTLAAKGIIDLQKYHDRLVLAGYPEPFPAAMVDDTYAELSPRALSAFTDGSEADRPWLARKLRGAQLSPEDTERVIVALELKATQPGRQRVIGTLLDQYQHGRLERPDLEAGLAGAGLSPTHKTYYLRAADLERRSYRMELVATEALAQYRNDLVGPETLRQMLTALGFSEDEVTVRLVAADLRRGAKVLTDEVRDIETEIRALKAEGLKNATRQLRAGFLGLAQFLAVGQGMGYARAYLQNVADLAYLQGLPTSTDAAPAIGLGALEETRSRVAELVAREVQAKRTDRVAALVSLRRLGLPSDLVSTIVGLAEAIAGPQAMAGDFGLATPKGGGLGFAAIAQAVLGGLSEVGPPSEVVTRLLDGLGLPGRDRSALVRLIRDVRDLFRL